MLAGGKTQSWPYARSSEAVPHSPSVQVKPTNSIPNGVADRDIGALLSLPDTRRNCVSPAPANRPAAPVLEPNRSAAGQPRRGRRRTPDRPAPTPESSLSGLGHAGLLRWLLG